MSTLLKFIAIVSGTLLAALVNFYVFFPHIPTLRYVDPGVTAMMMVRGWPREWQWVSLEKISPSLRRAVVESEDGNFYKHRGVDFHEMEASIRKNWKKKKYARGFSTITMQLARNLYLAPSKSLSRKALEMAITWKLEEILSKDRILEIYLNVIEWGDGVYGAEAAARHYFKKTAAKLSADEAVFLAAIIPSPRRWGKFPPGPFVARRKQVILSRIGFSGLRPGKKNKPQVPAAMEEEVDSTPEDGI